MWHCWHGIVMKPLFSHSKKVVCSYSNFGPPFSITGLPLASKTGSRIVWHDAHRLAFWTWEPSLGVMPILFCIGSGMTLSPVFAPVESGSDGNGPYTSLAGPTLNRPVSVDG